MDLSKFEASIDVAVRHFWDTRYAQGRAGKKKDTGSRSSVTGGRQLDGFIQLMIEVALFVGIPKEWIYIKGTTLPGYFRPTKNWDLLIISDKKELIAVLELKSQVGSFGNNFNNRTEEALGSALDLWTAFREQSFGSQIAPWLGYLMVIEESNASTRPIQLKTPIFAARAEYEKTSYIDRYESLCMKLVAERHYTAASIIATKMDCSHRIVSELSSIQTFLRSFVGHLSSRL